ncbi:AraC family transcriptional regulator [Lacrimispora sp. BS-2]|uniref:AraC family transcriptional regulator n=1 Tax=Lacrimispora sp. BS-2 TaxID=3151850 RepID=A0AAU7PWW9_9FIRM
MKGGAILGKEEVIGKAIIFIENNLYNSISACDVAKAAGYSYYHFHRYFYVIMGETIRSYIRGRRLTQAAWSLVHTDNKMFKLENQCSLEARIVNTIPKYIMGIRFKTDIDTSNIVEMWSIFNELVSRLDYDVCACKRYSIFESTESCSVDKFNADSEATVFIGIEVHQNNNIPEEMLIKRLVSNKYAKFTHTGTAGSLLKTYRYIWGYGFRIADMKSPDMMILNVIQKIFQVLIILILKLIFIFLVC